MFLLLFNNTIHFERKTFPYRVIFGVESNEVVKSETSFRWYEARFRSTFEMPLANVTGAITSIAQNLRQERLIAPQRRMVLNHAVTLAILAGQHRCSARGAHGIGAKRVTETRGVIGKPIQVRSMNFGIA